ncbi:MAG: hypothetical protein V9E90_14720 [Saprospiraceae bacterium]|jgi:hypothetical protein
MKKFLNWGIAVIAFLAVSVTACKDEEQLDPVPVVTGLDGRTQANNKVFPLNSQPFGKPLASWTEDWWRYAFSLPCEINPLMDETGIHADKGQKGPVYFLVGNSGGVSTRKVVIPYGKGILFPIINVINDAPCPNLDYTLAPGQTLEDYLKDGAKTAIDMAENLAVELDGKSIGGLEQFRVPTNLFTFIGDPDLSTCVDPCILGTKQDAVSDGYWILLKPLSKGSHLLHFHGEIQEYEFVVDVTYQVSVL